MLTDLDLDLALRRISSVQQATVDDGSSDDSDMPDLEEYALSHHYLSTTSSRFCARHLRFIILTVRVHPENDSPVDEPSVPRGDSDLFDEPNE